MSKIGEPSFWKRTSWSDFTRISTIGPIRDLLSPECGETGKETGRNAARNGRRAGGNRRRRIVVAVILARGRYRLAGEARKSGRQDDASRSGRPLYGLNFGLIGEIEKVITSGLSLARRSEDRALVALENLEPRFEIADVILARFGRDAETGHCEGGAEFGDQFLERIGSIAEPLAVEVVLIES